MRDLKPNFIEVGSFMAIGPSKLNKNEILEKMKHLEAGEIFGLADKKLISWPGAREGIRRKLVEEVNSWPVEQKLIHALYLFEKAQKASESFGLYWGHNFPWPNFMKYLGLTVYSIRPETRAVDLFIMWGIKYKQNLYLPQSERF